MWVRVEDHPNGRRLHVWRWRWHHYTTGATLIGVGVYLIVWDWPDVVALVRRRDFDPSVIGVTTTSQPDGW